MRHLPPTKALIAFQVAARFLSFTHAAKALYVTQGAVSHQIQGLEQLLEVKLFIREKQRLRLTEQGHVYLAYVSDALAILQKGSDHLAETKNSGVLTVSVSPNFASKWLVHKLGDFVNSYPQIELRLSASMSHVNLEQSDIDIAVRHGNNQWPDLDVTKLCSEHSFAVCSPDFLLANPQLLEPKNLLTTTLLHDKSRQDWLRWFTFADVAVTDLPSGPQFDQTSLVIDAAIEGQGVALARSALASRDLLSGRLIKLFKVSMPAPFAYYIVNSKAVADHDKIKSFKKWMKQQAAQDAVALRLKIDT